MDQRQQRTPIETASDAIAGATNSDVIFINAPIQRPLDDTLIELVRSRRRRDNVLLLLVTTGGDADAAYRMARCLQEHYKRFTFLCSGFCKSAGTLVAVGAHELVIAECGELGPLDVQMTKTDELMQVQSGLTVTTALTTLHKQAYSAFEHFFLQTVRRGGYSISTRTATHIAVQLATGLLAPMYEHIDPMHVGEAGRALQIAVKYGQLLQAESGNLKADALQRLSTGFPSHGFVIDRAQAEDLFHNVRRPTSNERALIDLLDGLARDPVGSGTSPYVGYVSTEPEAAQPGLAFAATIPGDHEHANETQGADGAASGDSAPAERPEGAGADTSPSEQRGPAEVHSIAAGNPAGRHR